MANKARYELALFNKLYNRHSQLSRLEGVKQWRHLPGVNLNQLLDILKKTMKPELFREDRKNFYSEQKNLPELVV